MKKIIGLLSLSIIFLSACWEETEETFYFYATSENWSANMEATQPPPPENNVKVELEFFYTGTEQELDQDVTYEHIQQWHGDGVSVIDESNFLPLESQSFQPSMHTNGIIGGYEVDMKWVTHVHWIEDGVETVEELVFEKQN